MGALQPQDQSEQQKAQQELIVCIFIIDIVLELWKKFDIMHLLRSARLE